MTNSSAKAVAELLMRDQYVDNEVDAWRAAKWILCLAQEPTGLAPQISTRRPEAPR